MRGFVPLGLLLPLSLACYTPPAASPPPDLGAAPAGTGALRVQSVPDQVGDFRRTDVHRYPQRELGTTYRYSDGSRIRLDVYVYPVGESDRLAGDSPAERARAEGRQLSTALDIEQRRGRIRSFQVVSDSMIVMPVRTEILHGSHLVAGIDVRGRNDESHQYIFILGDQFVKVRASFPPRAVPVPRLEEFVRTLLSQMTRPDPEPAAVAKR